MTFAALLRQYREAEGYTQSGLARQIGVNNSYVNRMEAQDWRQPGADVVDAICATLDLTGMEADRLRIAAGHVPNFAHDPTVLQLVGLLECLPPRQVEKLRAIIGQLAARYLNEDDLCG